MKKYTMKEACEQTGLTYDTLKYYCNEGLVPFVERDENNYRIFSENDIDWLKNLECLKRCNMSIAEMKEYLKLCLEGETTIPERREILRQKQLELKAKLKDLKDSIDYLDWKQDFYDQILSGRRPNLPVIKHRQATVK